MKQRSRGMKSKNKMRAAQAVREARVLRVQLAAGYAIVAISAVAGFFISPAIGFGLAALALFRLWVLRRELRRQSAEASEGDAAAGSAKPPLRISAKRA